MTLRLFLTRFSLGGQPVAISYAYAPGEEEHDGATVKLPIGLVQESLSPACRRMGRWPGLREEQIGGVPSVRLPKSIRRELMPLPAEKLRERSHAEFCGPARRRLLARFSPVYFTAIWHPGPPSRKLAGWDALPKTSSTTN